MKNLLDFENPTAEDIVDLILEYGQEITRLEGLMQAAVLFLDTQGVSVEEILNKRKKQTKCLNKS